MGGIFTSEQFYLGVGLATGPALLIIFTVYAFFKWGRSWQQFIQPPDSCNVSSVFCLSHTGLVKDTGFVIDECKTIWLEIKDINKRQMSLREKLPKDYVSKSDLTSIQDRLKSIDDKLDRYMEFTIKHQR